VSADALREDSNVQGAAPAFAESGPIALAKNQVVADAWVASRIQSADDDIGGLVLRYQDANNMYRVVADPSSIRIEKISGGVRTVLAQSTPGVAFPSGVEIGARVTGTTIQAFVNGAYRFSATDSTFRTGRVGVTKVALTNTLFHYLDVIHNG
jgi:hypothetical protein